MKNKPYKIIWIILSGVILAVCLGLFFTGLFIGWGPFEFVYGVRMKFLKGNSETYSVENVSALEESPLDGKHIAFLGSSVTFGSASGEESFVEFVAKRNNCTYEKYAVSGTTLVDNGENSYIARLKTIDKTAQFDLFICQLSTNDAAKGYSAEMVKNAIENIIDYVSETFSCPIVFYTNCYYENAHYAEMVELVKALEAEYPCLSVIDLYSDADFNDLTDADRKLYMADKIHPTKAGYLEWWTPEIEKHLYEIVKE